MKKFTLCSILCLLLLSFVGVALQAQTIYITPDGAGDQSGSSWDNAAPGEELQAKINAASSGTQIWVAEGTYYPNTYPGGCTNCGTPRNYTFQLKNGVSVYGGFEGSETATGQRDIQQHTSNLSGDIGTEGNDADNAFHIVVSIKNDATARLDGFTIKKGKADGSSSISVPGSTGINSSYGAGYYGYQSSPAIANCTFTANAAQYEGAGMYNYYYSSPVITDCAFSANTSTYGKGSGMTNQLYCSPVVKRCSFQNNSAFDAGGVYNENSSPAFTDCRFSGNSAPSSGSSGGGVYNSYSPATFTNCSFTGNKASRAGGLYNVKSTVIVTNCLFADNIVTSAAGYGAGISNTNGSSLTATGCSFVNNGGGNDGGAIYNNASFLTSTNCVFAGNSTLFTGGAIYSSSYSSSPISLNITNCTFYGNRTTDPSGTSGGGGAIYNGSYSSLSVTNSIIWGNEGKAPGISNPSGTTAAVSFSNVQDGYAGEGNIDTDPLFVNAGDPSGADDRMGTADDGLRLSCTSPAINKGSNSAVSGISTDITGAERVQYSIVDMGAYESPHNTPGTPSVTISGDPGSTICAGTPVTFTAIVENGGGDPVYEWKKNGAVVGRNDAAYTTSDLADGDEISVRLTKSGICGSSITASDNIKVTVNAIPEKPTVTASGATTLCGGGSVTLSAPSGYNSYKWSNGGDTRAITVNEAGAYSVSVTNADGCTSVSSAAREIEVNAVPPAPVVTVTNNCGSSTLSIPAGGTILWSSGAATSSIKVNAAGTYTVTRTVNGCTSVEGSGIAAPGALPVTPVVTVLNTCGISTLSTSSKGGSLRWSTGATTPLIIVSTPGTYTVTQTVNGCTSLPGSGTAAPKALPATPVVTVSNKCGSSVLSTTAAGSLLWSTGATTRSITVSKAGTYFVVQVVNGCPSLPGSGIAAPNNAPSIAAGNIIVNTGVTNCSASVAFASNVTISGAPAPAIVYKKGNTVISSPYTFPVGVTTVTATATNTCGSATKTFTITVKDNQAPVITCKPGATKTVSGPAYTISGTEFNATASDNCGTPSLIYSLSGATSVAYKSTNTSLAGVKLNTGTTTIAWKATDASDNVSTCSTVVKVSKSNAKRSAADWDAEQVIAGLSAKVAPNPSSNYFTLQLKSGSSEKCKLIIADVTGRLIEQRSNLNASGTLQIGSSYRPGTYVAVILQGNDRISIQLVKQGN